MGERSDGEPAPGKNHTSVERKSACELVITRRFDAPARVVFDAWTKPELFKQWWAPKSMSMTLLSCEMDVRGGGKYRLEFLHEATQTMAFFGTYIEVTPHSRLVWTNEESKDGAVTSVTFQETGAATLVVLHERYPSREAFDAGAGAADAMDETFGQLDELLVALGTSAEFSSSKGTS